MPPKKQQKPSAKSEQKKKERVVEDKTFGLKNKKGGKQQKFIKNVNQQVKFGGNPSTRKQELLKEEERRKREEKKKTGDDLDGLFKPVMQQSKVGKGADPKSVLCAFFKQGMCHKGAKCKFSHDLTIERKSEKRSLYLDTRGEDSMDTWDENKLLEVVQKKHGAQNTNNTEKVCKHFLQAIEEKKYGWFWVCPNGGDQCMYRHALPPGFILKSEKKKMEEQIEKVSIEDLVEKERAALGSNVTKITLESFLVWKKKKRQEKQKELEASKEKRKTEFKSGVNAVISGREMFEFRPELVNQEDDDDDAEATTITVSKCDDLSENVKDLSISSFTPTDNTAPVVKLAKSKVGPAESEQLGAAAANTNGSATISNIDEEVPVDEDLFTEELDDLDELDDD